MAATAPDDLHDEITRRLADRNLRYTRSRRALVEILASAGRPLTLPQVLDSDRTLAQSSAYRNLAEFTDAGVTNRIFIDEEHSYFELAEDLTSHHHHVVCNSCGRIDDFTASSSLESELHRALRTVSNSTGFALTGHRLDLVGRCGNCITGIGDSA
ncbi:MAG: transcriptional repressor [Actinobacteria bacterium]|nr:transcriptional repressor [Actinomycetota bacterium]